MVKIARRRQTEQGWWVRHAPWLKSVFRMLFGIVWLIDGALKFTSGFVNSFPTAVATAQSNSPGWLSGWYSFWLSQATGNAPLIVYSVGALELLLGIVLVIGFMRKVAYLGGAVLSLLIWAVPEGFGGPYAGGTGGTDVGAGVVYAILFLALITLNASFGPSEWSLDYYIEKRWPRWAVLAEFQRLVPQED
ncbi:MAG: DoxX family membrane protein [Thermoplasmata archaeon]|nr:DoxX family membrane protein [Thermoplasmata archaeon]